MPVYSTLVWPQPRIVHVQVQLVSCTPRVVGGKRWTGWGTGPTVADQQADGKQPWDHQPPGTYEAHSPRSCRAMRSGMHALHRPLQARSRHAPCFLDTVPSESMGGSGHRPLAMPLISASALILQQT